MCQGGQIIHIASTNAVGLIETGVRIAPLQIIRVDEKAVVAIRRVIQRVAGNIGQAVIKPPSGLAQIDLQGVVIGIGLVFRLFA